MAALCGGLSAAVTVVEVIDVLEVLIRLWWSPTDPGLPAVNALNSDGK